VNWGELERQYYLRIFVGVQRKITKNILITPLLELEASDVSECALGSKVR
jgi:hypothetical protein